MACTPPGPHRLWSLYGPLGDGRDDGAIKFVRNARGSAALSSRTSDKGSTGCPDKICSLDDSDPFCNYSKLGSIDCSLLA